MHVLRAKIWSLDEEKAKSAQPKEVRLFIQLFRGKEESAMEIQPAAAPKQRKKHKELSKCACWEKMKSHQRGVFATRSSSQR